MSVTGEAGRGLVVAAAIVDRLSRPTVLLAARRSAPPELAGGWEFPGGKAEPGEAALAALHREIREELGVSIRVGEEIPGPESGTWPVTSGFRMRVWLAEITDDDGGGPRPLVDHDELRWLAAGDWHGVPWLAADLPIVAALAARAADADAAAAPTRARPPGF